MGNAIEKTGRLLNAIAGQLPLADKTDLSPLISVGKDLDAICNQKDSPKALITQATRATSLTNNVIMGEIDFNEGVKKLGECIAKMLKSLNEIEAKTKISEKSGKKAQ